jgi:hypothetical protein
MLEDFPFINKRNIKISSKINNILNLVSNKEYITCFDCEFQSYLLDNDKYIGENISIGNKLYNIKSFVLEIGGILLKKDKKDNQWYIIGDFMFNNPILINEDRKIFNYQTVRMLIPEYINTKESTMKKINKYYNNILSSVDEKKFMNSFDRRSETKFRLFGSFFRNEDNFLKNYDNKKMFEYHVKIIEDYSRDIEYRTYDIVEISSFYYKISKYSTLLVKGNRDIESMKNIITLTNYKYDTNYSIRYVNKVDIESFNNIFKIKTGSAKLEDNYKSVIKTKDSMIKKLLDELEKIHSMKKAHNPLVDALFTFVVCIYIYKFIKPTELKGGSYLINYNHY